MDLGVQQLLCLNHDNELEKLGPSKPVFESFGDYSL